MPPGTSLPPLFPTRQRPQGLEPGLQSTAQRQLHYPSPKTTPTQAEIDGALEESGARPKVVNSGCKRRALR